MDGEEIPASSAIQNLVQMWKEFAVGGGVDAC
jgi:hypothetical protein